MSRNTAGRPPATDNSTIIFFAGQIAKQQEILDAARKGLAVLKRRAKRAGVDVRVFDKVLKLRREPDPDYWTKFQAYARALEMPIGYQLNLFAKETAINGAETIAARHGYVRGLQGSEPDPANNPDSKMGKAHMQGWRDGRRELTAKIIEARRDQNGKAQS